MIRSVSILSNKAIFFSGVLLLIFFFTGCSGPAGYQVTLEVGDNFQQANDLFPAGTTFIVRSGIHQNQRVKEPKTGNSWIGEEGAILDGNDRITEAFSGKAQNVTIQGLTIRNYTDNGVHFRYGKDIVLNRLTVTDTGSGTGHENGAIRLYRIQNIHIANSSFNRVTAGILPTHCRGPVLIENNIGIDIGRNFIQIDKCLGEDIVIQYNIMERQTGYLRGEAEDVVDWISVYKSAGTLHSPIMVQHNRARGHGNDEFGSFIMLGDEGGKYQIAKNNIGINPGQVGIGIAGGDFIFVKENILYSSPWEFSNVAFYSANFTDNIPCSNHLFRGNRSYWISNSKNAQNNIWTDYSCDPVVLEKNLYPDFNLNSFFWYESDTDNDHSD